MPLNDDYEEISFSQKYGMLGANDIFDGIAFWENSPIYNKPPYSFHWYENKFHFWIYQSKREGRFEEINRETHSKLNKLYLCT